MAEPLLDARAQALAQTLAERHGTTLTQAIVFALEAAIAREESRMSLAEQVDAIAKELIAESRPGGHVMTRDEIDAMWGQ